MKLQDLTFERIEHYDPLNLRAKKNGTVSEWVARNSWGNAVALETLKQNVYRMLEDTSQFRIVNHQSGCSHDKQDFKLQALIAVPGGQVVI